MIDQQLYIDGVLMDLPENTDSGARHQEQPFS